MRGPRLAASRGRSNRAELVLEMGGRGNIQTLIDEIHAVAGPVETPWFFPSVGEYATVLESVGFEVREAALFDRPTEVEGKTDWRIGW